MGVAVSELTYVKLLVALNELWKKDGKTMKEPEALDILDDLATLGVNGASDAYFQILNEKED